MGAGGDLRHHAAEGRVLRFLAQHRLGQDGAVGGRSTAAAVSSQLDSRPSTAPPARSVHAVPSVSAGGPMTRACRPPRATCGTVRPARTPTRPLPAASGAAAWRRRALPLRVGTRASPLALWQTRHFLSIITGFCPVLRDAGRLRGARHPHHRRPHPGPAPGGDRRQGPVRQGDPRGAAGPPHRFRRAQPEGPGNRAARRHRAGLHPEAGGRAGRADPRRRADGAAGPGRPLGLPAGRRGGRHRLGPAAGAAAARRGPTCASPRSAATCRPGWPRWRRGEVRGQPAGAGRAAPPRAGGRGGGGARPGGDGAGRRPGHRRRHRARADDVELRELLAAIEDREAAAVSTAERALLARAGRVLPHADRRPCAAAAERRPAPDRAGGARGRLVPAEAAAVGAAGDAARLGAELGRELRRDARATSLPERLPESGAAVLVTRPEPGAAETARRVAALGWRPVLAPALVLAPRAAAAADRSRPRRRCC